MPIWILKRAARDRMLRSFKAPPIVCLGHCFGSFIRTGDAVELTLKVGFIPLFVVVDPADLGPTIVVAWALCLITCRQGAFLLPMATELVCLIRGNSDQNGSKWKFLLDQSSISIRDSQREFLSDERQRAARAYTGRSSQAVGWRATFSTRQPPTPRFRPRAPAPAPAPRVTFCAHARARALCILIIECSGESPLRLPGAIMQ